MAKYVKNSNGYHLVVGESDIQGTSANLTACGVKIVDRVKTEEFSSRPNSYCKLCQKPNKEFANKA